MIGNNAKNACLINCKELTCKSAACRAIIKFTSEQRGGQNINIIVIYEKEKIGKEKGRKRKGKVEGKVKERWKRRDLSRIRMYIR